MTGLLATRPMPVSVCRGIWTSAQDRAVDLLRGVDALAGPLPDVMLFAENRFISRTLCGQEQS